MALRDIEAQNRVLDLCFGTTRGPGAADSHEVALLDEDGVELTDENSPGYQRATVLPADWGPAEGGIKSVLVTFAPPTDEWVDAVAVVLIGDDGLEWNYSELVEPLVVTSSGPSPTVTVPIFFNNDDDLEV